jgi:membrane associated rhomboid family serine protease
MSAVGQNPELLTWWLAANPHTFWKGYLWQPVTSVLVHTRLFHLISNILFLIISGHQVEKSLGKKHFISLFLIAAAGTHAIYVIGFPFSSVPIWGITGGINAVLGVFAISVGYTKIRFFGLLPITGKTMAMILAAFNTLSAVNGLNTRLVPLLYLLPFLAGYGYARWIEKRLYGRSRGNSQDDTRSDRSARFRNIDLKR